MKDEIQYIIIQWRPISYLTAQGIMMPDKIGLKIPALRLLPRNPVEHAFIKYGTSKDDDIKTYLIDT